jgi:hypothetical protein
MKFNLFLISVIIILACGIKYYHKKADETDQLNKKYQQSQNQLAIQLRRIHNEKIILQQQKTTLETCAIKDKPIFNWHIDISNTSVIKQLQTN